MAAVRQQHKQTEAGEVTMLLRKPKPQVDGEKIQQQLRFLADGAQKKIKRKPSWRKRMISMVFIPASFRSA